MNKQNSYKKQDGWLPKGRGIGGGQMGEVVKRYKLAIKE